MANIRAILISMGFLFLACGCAGSTPAVSPAEPQSSFIQVDDKHFVRIADVRAVEFQQNDPAPGVLPFEIHVYLSAQNLSPLVSIYPDQASADDAWNRVTKALGGTPHDEKRPAVSKTSKPPVTPASQPVLPTASGPVDDGYTHLTQQLGWLMKCVDAKLLTDAEYQQGRAWAIADLQANPQGGPITQGVFQRGGRPDFEGLYRQLVGLAKSKEAGLLTDEEAAKVRASIVKQAGLVE